MVAVRPARPDDFPAIVEIQNHRLHETTHEWTDVEHTVEEWTETLRRKSQAGEPVLVAEVDGEVVGWTTYGDFRDSTRWEGYRATVELTIHVRHDQWGRGIGRRLMAALADHARQAGKAVLVAGIDSMNQESIAFHAGLGFVETARMPGVGRKLGRRLDLVLMQRDLTTAGVGGEP